MYVCCACIAGCACVYVCVHVRMCVMNVLLLYGGGCGCERACVLCSLIRVGVHVRMCMDEGRCEAFQFCIDFINVYPLQYLLDGGLSQVEGAALLLQAICWRVSSPIVSCTPGVIESFTSSDVCRRGHRNVFENEEETVALDSDYNLK